MGGIRVVELILTFVLQRTFRTISRLDSRFEMVALRVL